MVDQVSKGKPIQLPYSIKVSFGDDGSPMAAYIRFRQGKSAETREIKADTLLADYDQFGNLLGLELLGPVSVQVLIRAVPDEALRPSFRKWVNKNVPPSLRAA